MSVCASERLSAQVVAVRAGTLIDGRGGQPVRNAVIVIRGDRIESVGTAVPAGARVIDLSRSTVLPGFIDLHVHLAMRPIGEGDWVNSGTRESIADDALFGARNARQTLEAGFTTVRDVGSRGFTAVALRNAVNGGVVAGPRIVAGGYSIGISGGHCDDNGYAAGVLREPGPLEGIANGPEAIREAIRLQVKYGADVIKICATGGVLSQGTTVGTRQLDDEELATVVRVARFHDRRVAAHAHGTEGIIAASRAGVTTIEHGSFMTEEAARVLVENRTWFVPTLMAGFMVGSDSGAARLPPWAAVKGRAAWAASQRGVRIAQQAGVRIALGTDAGVFPHGTNGREFELLVTYAGMTPMQAIVAGTGSAADALGREDVGVIEAGRFADLVAVNGDPLANIALLRTPVMVIKGGEVVFQTVDGRR